MDNDNSNEGVPHRAADQAWLNLFHMLPSAEAVDCHAAAKSWTTILNRVH